MNKRLLCIASCILAAFTLVLTACRDPSDSEFGVDGYTFTVIFDKNHPDPIGWSEANPKTKTVRPPANTLGSLPTPPTRQNWVFTGWNTNPSGNGTLFTEFTPLTRSITLYAQWSKGGPGFTVNLNISGKIDGESVTLSHSSGLAGDTVIINYTVVKSLHNNRLVFSGVSPGIEPVSSPGSGTRIYVINEADSSSGIITINANFTHTDLELDTIEFTGAPIEDKTYGDGAFTKGLSKIGKGNGTVSYSSSNTAVATVNSATGEIIIVGAGTSVITAVKVSDGEYEKVEVSYTLNIAKRQLIINNPNVTTIKTYNGNASAAVTAGALTNKVGNDTVNVTATATYNSPNVTGANQITVVYEISGSSASNYIKPTDYTIAGTITRASGIDVASAPTAAENTSSGITLTPVILINNSTFQTVEYSVSTATSPVPSSGWQDSRSFNNLNANTSYYFFARSKASDNYQAGTAKVSAAIKTQEIIYTVALKISGNVSGDIVTLSTGSGAAGVNVTINYTVANTGSAKNELVFSNVSTAISPVTTAGTGTKTYVINGEDSANNTITINAVFNHTDQLLDIIAFGTPATENRTYGDAIFTKALTNTGSGSGVITYSSSDTSVATVTNSGVVTIIKDGSAVITATKASDGTYAAATATYTLKVAQKQLTMSNPTVTTNKTYNNNTTAAVTAGTVNGKVGSDDVSISTAANYNSANVADANLITVVYTMSGTDAGKYIKPADYTLAGTITKATGTAMSSSTNLTAATTAQTSVTLNTIGLTGGSTVQTVEYAYSTTNSAPISGWQDGLSFNNLTANTTYYFFARSKENANYKAGTAKASAAIKTQEITYTVTLKTAGNVSGDSVTLSTGSGTAGVSVTINYTVVSSGNSNNRLAFTGVNLVIDPVNEPGTGTRTYTINEADAANGAITITATFTHTNLQSNTIAFTGATENKTYGDTAFTKPLTTTGSGSGAITWSSSDTTVATVTNAGLVTILKNGTSTITALKASDGIFTGATATYTLNVAQKQLTMSNQTVTASKTYNNNTTAAVTVGTVNGKVGNDTVSISTAANYNSANVADANLITVVYTMSGTDAGKYIKPTDYTLAGTITKATGTAMGSGAITAATTAQTSVTLSTARLTGDSTVQTIEYARATTNSAPTTGWQDSTTFNNLTPNTQYYFFARSKENANYNAGTAKASAAITTLKTVINVAINRSGNVSGDNATLSSTSGSPGDTVTINYTLARTGNAKNELVFSGVNLAIDPVNAGGTGTAVSGNKTYTINESDAANGTITITATFTHTNLTNDVIAFGTPATENRTYGDTLTKTLSNSGNGTGTISYSSSDTAVATVNSSTGAVTMLKNGTTTITATKASDGNYAGTTATYTLNVAQRLLTIANPTLTTTKTYVAGNTSATVTAGALTNKLSADTVTASAVANYDTADAGTGKQITVVYTIAGADAGKYIKPVNYTATGTITKADGIAMGSGAITAATTAQTSVILSTARLTGDSAVQTIEYARASAETPVPTNGWQDDTTFTGLTVNTQYYFFARSKENANYNAGTAKASAAIRTANLQSNTIAFTGNTESRQYGDTFTKTITTTGSGSGVITYSSGTTTVATVNSNTGAVTVVGSTGTSVITATKASDGIYAAATATYTLTVTQRQLTKANPTVTTTKTYNGDASAAVTTVGALNNVVSGDTVTVSATATYNTADAGTNKQITVVYIITGADIAKYIKPVDYTTTGTINKATGSALNANPTAASSTSTSVTLNAATLTTTTGQTIEYARATNTTVPTTDWQEVVTFTGLTANTQYYFFARSKENTNYSAGAVRTSAAIRTPTATTPSVPPTKIDFEADAVNKTYSSTKGANAGTMTVIADPVNSGQKSLRVTASGYNQAPIIPVNLPHALGNYETLSFRINITSGSDLGNKSVMAYAAGDTATFKDHGFGNPADSTYPQFAANLAGQTTPAVDFAATTYKDKWTTFTINLNPGSSATNLKGDIFIAFGFNSESAVYLIDDLVFTIKPSFVPPAPPPSTTLNPPSTGAVSSKTYRNMFKEFGKSDAEITAKVNTTFNKLFNGTADQKIYYEVSGDMAYILDVNNNDVRSEGMSYGMMMAVQMDDQTKFNKLWRWAKTYMYNTGTANNCRAYFAWQCGTSGNKMDPGCAPDGEFYFATALLFADARWGSASGATNVLNYRQHAMELLYEMIHRDTSKGDANSEPPLIRDTDYNGYGKYMTTFQPQGSAARFTDPSYHLPAFYDVWAIEMEKDADAGKLYGMWSNAAAMRTDVAFYKEVAKTSRAFFKKTTNANTGLGPDYAKFDGSPEGGGDHATFYYDAFRIAMNIAMDYAWFAADSWQKDFADRILTFFHGKGVTTYRGLWELNGTARNPAGDHSPGLVACNAVASLAATKAIAWEFLDDFWNIDMTSGKYRYYDGCLYMLGLLHVTGNFKAYLSGTGTYIPSSNIDPTSATFDKRSDLQKDIVVTLTLNGNTLSNIRNGGTTLTSGTTGNYTLSGSTVTLRSAYLATLPIGTTTLTFNFSAGSVTARTLDITVRETPVGGTPSGGTTIDFSTMSSYTAETVGNSISASLTDGKLRVVSSGSYTNAGVVITLDLGSQTLGSFSGLRFIYQGVSGDTGYKNLRMVVAGTAGGTPAVLDNGSNLRLINDVSINGTAVYDQTVSFASTAPLTRSGEIKVLIGIPSSGSVTFDITRIELIP